MLCVAEGAVKASCLFYPTMHITIFHTFELFPMYNTVTSVIVLSKATLSLDNDQM